MWIRVSSEYTFAFVRRRQPLSSTILNHYILRLFHSEWITNQHRDTYASHVAHYDQLSYYAVAQNESIGRVRLQFLEKMIQPCGP